MYHLSFSFAQIRSLQLRTAIEVVQVEYVTTKPSIPPTKEDKDDHYEIEYCTPCHSTHGGHDAHCGWPISSRDGWSVYRRDST